MNRIASVSTDTISGKNKSQTEMPIQMSIPMTTTTTTTTTKTTTTTDGTNEATIQSKPSNSNSNSKNNSNTNTLTNKFRAKKKKSNVIQTSVMDALAGASAGAVAKTAVAPVERVKLLMQLRGSITNVSPSSLSLSSSSSSTMPMQVPTTAWNVAKSIYYQEGILAFWRGNTPNVVRQGGAAALNFMLMDWYKAAIAPIMNLSLSLPSKRPHPLREKRRKILSSFLSGGLAGGTTTTFLYPIEFLRTRLALDVGSSSSTSSSTSSSSSSSTSLTSSSKMGNKNGEKICTRMYPRGMRDVFCIIYNKDGVRGLYQGYGIALSGVVLYRALHLGGFDACKTELLYRKSLSSSSSSSVNETITMYERFAIAQIVSIVAGTICYPIDSVRRRLMMQAGVPCNQRRYNNSIHAFRRIYMEEGMKGFYLGIGPNLFRSVGGALLLVAYDIFKGMIC
jgi:solute carrier family 25 (adenine nucleotide translocator) protein 4/5/6/31